MLAFATKPTYLFQADANALGGQLKEPVPKSLETQAPNSLSAAGGFARAQSGAFNLDHIVHCSSSYTVVKGVESEGGLVTTLGVAVIENLNILEVVRATRIEARVSVTSAKDGTGRQVSLLGTRFDGLVLGDRPVEPKFNEQCQQLDPTNKSFLGAVEEQAKKLIGRFKERSAEGAQWAVERHFSAARSTPGKTTVLCSLVDSVNGAEGNFGHIVDIPDFGRLFLGELLISPRSVRFITLRADLGCPVKGQVFGPTAQISGGQDGGHT